MREIERKFSTEQGFALPMLEIPDCIVAEPATVRLEATYFDTADLRLTKARITLRRRTGGKDAGWHLKLPADGEREEIQHPPGRNQQVPAALATLVQVHTRGRPLVPIVRLRTTRTVHEVRDGAGSAVAEIVEDAVRAQRLDGENAGTVTLTDWREVEVELLDAGRPELLELITGQLVAGGAVPAGYASKLVRALEDAHAAGFEVPRPPSRVKKKASAGLAVQAYLQEQLLEIMERDPWVRQDTEDALHQMRVATRRMRSALRAFGPLLADDIGPLQDELKWLAGVLGEARDREVLLERVSAELDAIAARDARLDHAGARALLLDEELIPALQRARDDARRTLADPRYLRLIDALVALAARPSWTDRGELPAREVLPPLVAKSFKRLAKRAATALDTGTEEDWHLWRKAAKRARYSAEAVQRVFGDDATALAAQAHSVQKLLGEHQDSVVTMELLRRVAGAVPDSGRPGGVAAGLSLGLLYAVERQNARNARAAALPAWREASRGRYRAWLR